MKSLKQTFEDIAAIATLTLATGGTTMANAHCPGDVDALVVDGRIRVNVFDFAAFAGSFGSVVPPGTAGDLDGSGGVNVFDFAILAGNFGCEAAVVEPFGAGQPSTYEYGFDDVAVRYPTDLFRPMWTGPLSDSRGTHVTGAAEGRLDVNPHSGEVVLSAIDLRVAGRMHDFMWARTYRSRTGPHTAQGNGWDFACNIYVEASGADLVLHSGDGRADLYENQAPSLWTDEERFCTLEQNPDLSFTLTFAHGDTWDLLPLDGSPAQGRISAITDRNGNAITLEYDGLGRLVVVRDTLHHAGNPREFTVAYNPDGFIASVTDFTGRQVTYEYYDGIEPGGSFGDLKSVTTPAVTGTPHGNDFPLGKTVAYTYSTGFANDRLNHNLITFTDRKGAETISILYGATNAPADLEYDRATRLTVGGPGDVIDLVYTELSPAPANGFACVKVTANDRVGNVSEAFYDDGARPVLVREYTGRADPDLPTDLDNALNPPVAPLRPGDPPFFETRCEWNADSLCTRVVHANQNESLLVYDELDPDRRSQGNLLSITRLPGPLGADQPSITEQREYDPVINFGTNFVTRHVDERGNQTLHEYDAAGNRTRTTHRIPSIVEDFQYNTFGQMTRHILPDNGSGSRREDAFTYYAPADGCMNGHLKDRIIDDTGFGLTTTYEYDCIGRITRTIDPRGNDTLHEYNALDQVVRTRSREVTTPTPARYERLLWYDANDNVVRVDRSNHDDQGTLDPANTHFTTIYEYDVLNYLTRVCDEKGSEQLDTIDDDCGDVDPNEFITTEYLYDANRNLIEFRDGEATNGGEGEDRVEYLYDERDLVFRETRAPLSVDRVSTRFGYDGNRNLVLVLQGEEAGQSPSYPGDAPHLFVRAYDGYDRLVQLTDPMSNVHICEYDAAGNRTRRLVFGETLDAPGDAGNVRLYEEACDYDAMDRSTECRTEHYDTATQTAIGDGQSTRSCTYSDTSQALACTDDNGNTTTYVYDSANRCATATDARGNSVAYVYDPNSNVTQTTETDKSDLGNPDEVFVTTYVYDSMDRLTRCVDPVGNQTDYLHDSRGNLTTTTDAKGNVMRYGYDGLDRLVGVDRDLTDTGDGTGFVIGTASTRYTYDDSSRVIAFEDDNAHVTLYAYDALDRLTVTLREDGTAHLGAYDHHHNTLQTMDPMGTVVDYEYDLLDRRTRSTVTVGPGVSNDTTLETYAYDGLSRLAAAQDDDSSVTFAYDSLSNRTAETLTIAGAPPRTTLSTYDGWSNRLECVYPGGRQISYLYDPLNRVTQVLDAGLPHAAFAYIGGAPRGTPAPRLPIVLMPRDRSRLETINYENLTLTSYSYDGVAPNPPGDAGVRKISVLIHVGPAGLVFDQRSYLWDPAQNKIAHDVLDGPPQLTTTYEYDSIDRLTRTTEVDPATTGIRRDTAYDLDDAGNRASESGSFASGGYVLDPTLPIPADFQVNQYTQTPVAEREHSENGSRTFSTHANTGDQTLYAYDYLDRLVSVTDVSTGNVVEFDYDALGRRIRKTGPAGERRFYYCARADTAPPLLIEERDGADSVVETHVRLNDLNTAFVADRRVSTRIDGLDYFYHCDDLGSTVALTDQSGAVVERYAYDDYGRVLITTAAQEADEPQGALVSDADPVPFGSAEEVAENVELDTRPITALRWWGGYSLSLNPADTFRIRIYADAGGIPGPLLYEELGVTQAGERLNGLSFGKPEHVYTYDLARPFTPPVPGQYWLSIQNDTSAQSNVAWAWTLSAGGDGQVAISTNEGPFVIEPFDVAFELYTDQSGVGNPYLFHGNRYDPETGLYLVDTVREGDLSHCMYHDPATGRALSRGAMDSLGNDYCYAGNNPTSRRRDPFVHIDDHERVDIDIPLHNPGWSFLTTDPAGPTWVPLFDLYTSRHSTSSSLGMASNLPPLPPGPPILFGSGAFTCDRALRVVDTTSPVMLAHVDSPGHADYIKSAYLLKKEEGGRHTPFHNKYRPQFYLRTTDVTGAITLHCDTVLLDPGVTLSIGPSANMSPHIIPLVNGSRNGNLHLLDVVYRRISTRSNIFAVWQPVGFFEVRDPRSRYFGGPVWPPPPSPTAPGTGPSPPPPPPPPPFPLRPVLPVAPDV